jgi:hypothetical protein
MEPMQGEVSKTEYDFLAIFSGLSEQNQRIVLEQLRAGELPQNVQT